MAFISNTSLEQKVDEDGVTWHRHSCCVCFHEWWDRASYGKWCSSQCFHDEDGYPEPEDYY
jgi:hypothetical protein